MGNDIVVTGIRPHRCDGWSTHILDGSRKSQHREREAARSLAEDYEKAKRRSAPATRVEQTDGWKRESQRYWKRRSIYGNLHPYAIRRCSVSRWLVLCDLESE